MGELGPVLAGVSLVFLIVRGIGAGLFVAVLAAGLQLTFGSGPSGAAKSLLIPLLGFLPFRVRPEKSSKLLLDRGPTLTFLGFSLLTVPFLIELMLPGPAQVRDITLLERMNPALTSAALTLYTATPILAALRHHDWMPQTLRRSLIIVGSLASLALLAAIFGLSPPRLLPALPLGFLLFVPVTLSALWLKPSIHGVTLLVIVLVVFWGDSIHHGPFHDQAPPLRTLLVNSFLLTIGLISWILSAQTQQNLWTESRLREDVESRTRETESSQMFLNAVIENIPDMIFVKDAQELKFVGFNRAGEQLLGISREKMLGRSDRDFFPPEEADHFTQIDREVLRSGRMKEVEEQISTPAHGKRWLRTKKMRIADSEGRTRYLLGISEDITVKREAEDQHLRLVAEKAARNEAEKNLALRNEFISVAAHELRTPVSALKLAIDVALRLLSPATATRNCEKKMPELLSLIQGETVQLQTLTESLLDVSRIQQERFILMPQPDTNLSELTTRALALLQGRFDKAGCTLITRIQQGVVSSVDPDRIQQLITQLLLNALKFGQGGPIEVLLESDEQRWRLEVADQGVGMDPETLARLSLPFERAASYRHFPGLGLGLFICRHIIAAHGGTLHVDSSPGAGARFILQAPLQPEAFQSDQLEKTA